MFSTSRANRVASAESALIARPLSNSNRRCCGMLGDRPARGWIDWWTAAAVRKSGGFDVSQSREG